MPRLFYFDRALNAWEHPRKEYWNNLRGAIRLMLLGNFDHLLRNVADPPTYCGAILSPHAGITPS